MSLEWEAVVLFVWSNPVHKIIVTGIYTEKFHQLDSTQSNQELINGFKVQLYCQIILEIQTIKGSVCVCVFAPVQDNLGNVMYSLHSKL